MDPRRTREGLFDPATRIEPLSPVAIGGDSSRSYDISAFPWAQIALASRIDIGRVTPVGATRLEQSGGLEVPSSHLGAPIEGKALLREPFSSRERLVR
jgi:hypothetical protein